MARKTITGVCHRGRFLEWTTLVPGKKGIERRAFRQVELEGEPDALETPAGLAEAIRRQCPELEGPVIPGLAPGKMLTRVVALPSTDPTELAAMVALQVDQFSPFPEDRMAVSHEILSASESSSLVLIAAVPKDQIESIGDLFRLLGAPIRRLDAEAMGWWRLLVDSGEAPARGRALLLVLEPAGGVWMAVQDGVLQGIKPVAPSEGVPEDVFVEELAGDMGALVLALDLERGTEPVKGLEAWTRGGPAPALAKRLEQELNAPVRQHRLEDLPPLSEGLARRQAAADAAGRGAAPMLDLVPASWRAAAGSRKMRRRLVWSLSLALGLWAVGVAAFFVLYQVSRWRLNRVERRLAAVQPDADGVRRLQRQTAAFERYLDRGGSALECLREISLALPGDVLLTAVQFKKGRTVSLRGESRDVEPVYDFKQALDRSALFQGVEMGSIQPSKRKDLTVQTFQMTLQLKGEPQ